MYWNASPQKAREPTDNIKKGNYKKHTLERRQVGELAIGHWNRQGRKRNPEGPGTRGTAI